MKSPLISSVSFLIFVSAWSVPALHVSTLAQDSETGNRKQALFVSGENGYQTFRIPAIAKTTTGVLLAFAEGRVNGQADHGDLDIVMRRSQDNGKTWSPLQVVKDDGEHQVGNPCPLVDEQTGRVFLFFCSSHNSEHEILNGTGSREVNMMTSDDEGATWSESTNISSMAKREDWRWYATGPCSAIQIQTGEHAGRFLLPVNHSVHFEDERPWEYRCHSLYSDDQGKTWHIGSSSKVGASETQIAEVAPDLLIQDIRMQTHRQGARAVRFSRDGGETWSEFEHDSQRTCPRCQGSIISVAVNDGSTESSLLISANAAGEGRKNMTVYRSEDAGKTWQKVTLLCEDPSAYIDLVVTGDQKLGCLYETGKASPYETIVWELVDEIQLPGK